VSVAHDPRHGTCINPVPSHKIIKIVIQIYFYKTIASVIMLLGISLSCLHTPTFVRAIERLGIGNESVFGRGVFLR
jgi:hypothetical protein